MEASTLYVRLEGVNLANFVEDVHDLSTIRGGSFLLLDAVETVRARFALDAISTGASSGLFRSGSTEKPEVLRGEIERFIHDNHDNPRLRHATIVVDVYATGKGFVHAREALTAMNRWRQFQQPTVAVPSRPETPVNTECALDHRRPGVVPEKVDDEQTVISASVKARRDHGRDQKQQFYIHELEKLPRDPDLDRLLDLLGKSHFAADLQQITDDKERGSLDGKMAIIYFDGNGFGGIQRKCDSPEMQSDFDETLKAGRRTALRRLLEEITSKPDGWMSRKNGEESIRLETLLWGGDELIWVVPAWKGWDVVRLFYDVSRDWVFEGRRADREAVRRPLTHAGGVVFCHRAAPIHRMTHLAKDLAEECKRFIKNDESLPDDHDARDLFAYQVLESFDHIGTELEAFRATRVPKDGHADELIVRARGLLPAGGNFAAVLKRFPRSKLHDIVRLLRDGRDAEAIINKTVADLDAATREALRSVFATFAPPAETPWLTQPTGWFHIAELWDYADPESNRVSETAATT